MWHSPGRAEDQPLVSANRTQAVILAGFCKHIQFGAHAPSVYSVKMQASSMSKGENGAARPKEQLCTSTDKLAQAFAKAYAAGGFR